MRAHKSIIDNPQGATSKPGTYCDSQGYPSSREPIRPGIAFWQDTSKTPSLSLRLRILELIEECTLVRV